MRNFLPALLPSLLLSLLLNAGASADETLWKIIAPAALKEGWVAVRINTSTGQCWEGVDGKWAAVKEGAAAPKLAAPGTYQAVVMWEQGNDAYHSMRWNVKTGESWILGGGAWIPFSDAAEVPK